MARLIQDLEISVRVSNCLRNNGNQTVDDLCAKTRAQLLKFEGFGRTSLVEVEDALDIIGRKLSAAVAPPTPPPRFIPMLRIRHAKIFAAYLGGERVADIADRQSVGKERVYGIMRRVRERLENGWTLPSGLSDRERQLIEAHKMQ